MLGQSVQDHLHSVSHYLQRRTALATFPPFEFTINGQSDTYEPFWTLWTEITCPISVTNEQQEDNTKLTQSEEENCDWVPHNVIVCESHEGSQSQEIYYARRTIVRELRWFLSSLFSNATPSE
jgi:hypothetical protein